MSAFGVRYFVTTYSFPFFSILFFFQKSEYRYILVYTYNRYASALFIMRRGGYNALSQSKKCHSPLFTNYERVANKFLRVPYSYSLGSRYKIRTTTYFFVELVSSKLWVGNRGVYTRSCGVWSVYLRSRDARKKRAFVKWLPRAELELTSSWSSQSSTDSGRKIESAFFVPATVLLLNTSWIYPMTIQHLEFSHLEIISSRQ